jgi:hypothetical protein
MHPQFIEAIAWFSTLCLFGSLAIYSLQRAHHLANNYIIPRPSHPMAVKQANGRIIVTRVKEVEQ